VFYSSGKLLKNWGCVDLVGVTVILQQDFSGIEQKIRINQFSFLHKIEISLAQNLRLKEFTYITFIF
jgi:hypothetical protein